MLLAARTKAAQKAAEYFIKIEESIPEFFNLIKRGGTAFMPPRTSDWKALPISEYTVRLTCKRPEGMIVSAGYNEDMSDPKAYFMRSGECAYPRNGIKIFRISSVTQQHNARDRADGARLGLEKD